MMIINHEWLDSEKTDEIMIQGKKNYIQNLIYS